MGIDPNHPAILEAIAKGLIADATNCSEIPKSSANCPEIPERWANEAEFQQSVIEFAQARGWKVAHFRKARTKRGWSTSVAADGKGFPDLVLVRDRIIHAELKYGPNKLTPEQREWEKAIINAGGVHFVWYPSDWEEIQGVLA